MQQPEGFTDNTRHICLLIKTLYGLKQSGYQWNIKLDTKLKKHRFKHILSDAYVYVCYNHNGTAIIIIWVDNLLLFASSDKAMDTMADQIKLEWEIIDLGEPQKIIGIKITLSNHAITISQKKYIESIL
jgi:hypothetical protein